MLRTLLSQVFQDHIIWIMELIEPTENYAESWKEAIKEFEAEERKGFWNVPEKPTDIQEYVQRTKDHSLGRNLPDYWVPATTYWLIDEDRFIGHVNIRHHLNENLEKLGGHIGYAIRPSDRGKGYGTKILKLVLPKTSKLGLQKALVTCDVSNIASQKIIEGAGGVLRDVIDKDEGDDPTMRYWITL